MAQIIKIKNSSVAAKVPATGDLSFGEIALNYADGKIYYKKSDNTIQSISGGGGGSVDLSSPGPIGGTAPAAGTFTTLIGGKDAANYGQLAGSATTKGVQFQTLGTDTNISMALQPKGTGAIDLASNVNISNGGTVTAITRTAAGSGYTSVPTVIISAPTTTTGVQAVVTAPVVINAITNIQSGGTSGTYAVNDVLTVQGGTVLGQVTTLTVTTATGGIVTAAIITQYGTYTTTPTNPVSVTGGGGLGATFNLNYAVQSGTFIITTAGSGYVEQPTVTFSGGGGSGAAAYATVGSGTVVRSIGTNLSFYTPAGEQLRLTDNGVSSPGFLQLFGSASGLGFYAGGPTTVSMAFVSKGAAGLTFATNSTSANQQFNIAHIANAVNYVNVSGAAIGGAPTISTQGSEINAGLNINSKGSGVITFTRGRDAVNSSQYLFTNVGGLAGDANGGAFWRGFHISPIPFTISGVNKFPRLAQYFEFDSITDPIIKNVYTAIGNSTDTIEHNFSNETGGGWTFRKTSAFGNDKSFVIAPPLTTDRNYLQVAGAATGASPTISVQGSDATRGFGVVAKGSGYVTFYNQSGTTTVFAAGGSNATNGNYLTIVSSALGAAPVLTVNGADTDIDLTLVTKGAGGINFQTGATTATQLRVKDTVGAINYLQIAGGVSGDDPSIAAVGSQTRNIRYRTGTGASHLFETGSYGNTQVAIVHMPIVSNYVTLAGSATGAGASALTNITFTGTDSSVNAAISVKGSGYIAFAGISSTNNQAFRVATTNAISTGNLLQVQGAVAGSAPILSAISGPGGSDTNIDLALTPKGTGAVLINSILGLNAVTASTTATTASQVLATFDATLYRTVKFIIQSTDATNYHSTEILAIHNGTTASYTEYATVTIGTACAVYSVDYSSATIRLLATPASATATTYKIAAQLTRI